MDKKNLRLNSVSAGTEALFHLIVGLFSICCIIPFIFVIIISFSAEKGDGKDELVRHILAAVKE